jgi:hypothetical protein
MKLLVAAFAIVLGTVALAQDPAGVWESELGNVTLEKQGTRVTGSWTTRAGQRGTIVEGTLDGPSLVFTYVWPQTNEKGGAAFTWNADSQRWEGSWRHHSGVMGGWNLSKGAGAAASAGGAAASGPWTLIEATAQPSTVRAGGTFELILKYQVNSASVALDETRRLVAADGAVKGSWNDRKQLAAGIHTSTRKVTTSPTTKPGAYEFRAELKEGARVETKTASVTVSQ